MVLSGHLIAFYNAPEYYSILASDLRSRRLRERMERMQLGFQIWGNHEINLDINAFDD